MSIVKKIPKSIKEIIGAIKYRRWDPLTFAELGDLLGVDPNVIAQRISRDKNYFLEISETRPRKVSVKKGVNETIFFVNDNQCAGCRKKFSADQLNVRIIDLNAEDKLAWNNIVTLCDECNKLQEPWAQVNRKPTPASKKVKTSSVSWEYLNVRIRGRKELFQNNKYYEFIEVDDVNAIDRDDWDVLTGDEEEESNEDEEENEEEEESHEDGRLMEEDEENITSLSPADVLNFYGKNGWELISINGPNYGSITSLIGQPSILEEYNCYFKRKVERQVEE
jgi:hypothetical protein